MRSQDCTSHGRAGNCVAVIPSEGRPGILRQHHPRQRYGLALFGRRAAQVSLPHPERLERAHVQPPARQPIDPEGLEARLADPITRFLVRFGSHDPTQRDPYGGFAFDPTTGRYVWHCHILEHEDNDMMRPYAIVN